MNLHIVLLTERQMEPFPCSSPPTSRQKDIVIRLVSWDSTEFIWFCYFCSMLWLPIHDRWSNTANGWLIMVFGIWTYSLFHFSAFPQTKMKSPINFLFVWNFSIILMLISYRFGGLNGLSHSSWQLITWVSPFLWRKSSPFCYKQLTASRVLSRRYWALTVHSHCVHISS